MRVTALVLIRASCYVTLGLAFGMLAFTRAHSYRQRTGANLWHTHPLVWGAASTIVISLATRLPMPVVVAIGIALAVVVSSALPPSRANRSDITGSTPGDQADALDAAGPPPPSGPVPAQVPTNAFRAWLPDPTRRHELRYFDGAAWTNHVADAGSTSVDEP